MREPIPFPVHVVRRPDGVPCHCGQPIPATRVAYCTDACRLADMDHGADYDTTEDAA
jgi:hypothetical protein